VFSIHYGLKQDALLLQLFNSALEYTIIRVQGNQEGLQFSGTYHFLVYAADNLLGGGNINIIKRNAEALFDARRRLV
jgi:hypothetical protein